jgi:CRISPR-associated protein Csm5
MRYRLTVLTPLLVGDGAKLSPIDYMVWRDQVNVLDQGRIFRLLARGPRLENYLKQIAKAEKLDFASWGGFAQNFAKRRIPFEHPAYTAYWERLPAEHLHIPTFVTSPAGPYLPATAIKGALRTALVFKLADGKTFQEVEAALSAERPPRQPGVIAEERTAGDSNRSRLRTLALADSAPVDPACLKIYLLRVATLERAASGKLELRWKQAPRGSVEARQVEQSTPQFAEMASPGTVFEGRAAERAFFSHPDVAQALGWKAPLRPPQIFEMANDYAAAMLAAHRQYAGWAQLAALDETLQHLEARLAEARSREDACLLSLGWGAGFLSKAVALAAPGEEFRQILRRHPLFSKALRAGLPFPKTRRIVFAGNRPAALAGWAMLEAG